MKKSAVLLIAGVVLLGAIVAYVVLSKDSADESPTGAANQSTQKSTKDNSSNFEKIKDEKLEGKLVSSFPSDEVPLYPGKIVSSLGKMNSAGDRGEWNVAVSTTDSYAEVDAAIRESYEAENWSIASESKSLMGGTMLIARSNKHTATITYDDMGEEGIKINYGVSQR